MRNVIKTLYKIFPCNFIGCWILRILKIMLWILLSPERRWILILEEDSEAILLLRVANRNLNIGHLDIVKL